MEDLVEDMVASVPVDVALPVRRSLVQHAGTIGAVTASARRASAAKRPSVSRRVANAFDATRLGPARRSWRGRGINLLSSAGAVRSAHARLARPATRRAGAFRRGGGRAPGPASRLQGIAARS